MCAVILPVLRATVEKVSSRAAHYRCDAVRLRTLSPAVQEWRGKWAGRKVYGFSMDWRRL